MLPGKAIILSLLVLFVATEAFLPPLSNALSSTRTHFRLQHLLNSAGEDDESSPTTSTDDSETTTKSSLEEKMKAWEATEEEVKAATLGGVVPGRSDAFDVGLYIAFPLMVISGLLFAFFPLIMGNIDTSDVGPPPTM